MPLAGFLLIAVACWRGGEISLVLCAGETMGGRPVTRQLNQVLPRFAVKEARPYHASAESGSGRLARGLFGYSESRGIGTVLRVKCFVQGTLAGDAVVEAGLVRRSRCRSRRGGVSARGLSPNFACGETPTPQVALRTITSDAHGNCWEGPCDTGLKHSPGKSCASGRLRRRPPAHRCVRRGNQRDADMPRIQPRAQPTTPRARLRCGVRA